MSWGAVAGAAVSTVGGAVLGGGSSSTRAPRYLRDASKRAVSAGQGISERPYEAYSGNRVAGLTGNEQGAATLAGSMSGRYQPMISRAGAAFSPAQLQQFENPYMEKVVQGRLDDVGRSYDTQLGGLSRKRGMMDAFGTDRGSMMETALMRDRARDLDRISNEGRASAYESALDSYFKDRSSALEAARGGAAIDEASVRGMLETGGREREVNQARADFDYGQFLEKRDWSVTNLQPLLDSIRAAQGTSGQSTSSTPNYGSLLAGLGTTVAGLYAQNSANSSIPKGLQSQLTLAGNERVNG